MKLVHDHLIDPGLRSFTERQVRENLRSTAYHRRPGIHGGIAGDHADIVRAKGCAKREKLLIRQGLDRHSIKRSPLLANGAKVQSQRHEGFPRTGRRIKNNILPFEQFQDRLFLMIIGFNPRLNEILQKGIQDLATIRGIGDDTGIEISHARRP